MVESVDTKRSPIKGAAALAVTRGVDELWVAKGRKVVRVDLRRARPGPAERRNPSIP